MNDGFFMEKALEQAEEALARREFPVGCVVVYEGEVIVTGARQGTADGGCNESDHAEMTALRRLDALNSGPDRSQLSLFCTLEPCFMCYGGILISNIGRLVYAYEDAMGGATCCDLSKMPPLYRDRKITIVPHVMRQESLSLFRKFFSDPENAYWKGSLLERYTLAQT